MVKRGHSDYSALKKEPAILKDALPFFSEGTSAPEQVVMVAVAHTFNSSTRETGRWIPKCEASLVYRIARVPG